MNKIRVGIAGAAGYTGCELIRLIERHPHAEICWLMTGPTHAGKGLRAVFPHLRAVHDRPLLPLKTLGVEKADVVFFALPHGEAMALVPEFLAAGTRVIDIGADFRLKNPGLFEKWYEKPHASPQLLSEAVYGLTELHREEIRTARLVANPGCYPTVSILCLAPLLREGGLDCRSLVIDAKSGVSGAGRGLSLKTHYAECDEDLQAYSPLVHRHLPEIEQELTFLAGQTVTVVFVPHLVPMIRGMLATVYACSSGKERPESLQDQYEAFYRDEPFVQVLDPGELPRTKDVWGTNRCEIAVRFDPRTGKVIVIGVVDNLLKGASGQAVQNMNCMFSLPESTGLDLIGVYP
jgi:N-acetyl-gamma-glutamyl-phosphate reductase